MQELISFISIMLGVVILTAWVMWILLRPSGDSKAKEFSQESTRNSLTHSVMENNELKNKVTRLERELKVLMNAGYKTSTDAKDDVLKTKVKGERLKVKEKKSRSVVPGAMVLDERQRTKDEGLKTKAEQARGKVKGKGKKTGAGALPVGGAPRGEDASRMKNKEEKSRSVAPGAMVSDERSKTKDERLKSNKVQPIVQKKAAKVVAAVMPAEVNQPSTVAPLSDAQQIIDAAEKKKVADYLASVAETTERQKKEVEALEEVSRHPDDDLKKIKGIGPHLEGRLKRAGISSYLQIAGFNENDIQHVSKVIGSYPRRIRREAWVEQAKVLVNKG